MICYLALIDTGERRSRFAELYEDNCALMMRQAWQILRDSYQAEDAVHNAFLRVAANMDAVERLDDVQARRYLLTAARNAAIDLYRRNYRQSKHEMPYEDREAQAVLAEAVSGEENAVLAAVRGLPLLYRDVFLLKYSLGLSNEEIGALLGISASGVRQRVTKGKELLRVALKEEGFDGAW